MRPLKTYWNILRHRGMAYAFRETWRTLEPRSFTRCQLHYLDKHYSRYIREYDVHEREVPRVLWVCWLQGLEAAPQLVQDCVAQLQCHAADYELRVVTSENIQSYADIPDFIYEKLRSGIISYTHFSDILRIFLLARHGGVWVDSTVLLSGPIPSYVTEGPLFFFRVPRDSRNLHVGSSWLIAAAPGHPLARNVAELLSRYWAVEDKLRDYYLFHDIMTLVSQKSAVCRQAVDEMIYVSNRLPHTYTEESFKNIPIHKLSYKHAIDYHLYLQ